MNAHGINWHSTLLNHFPSGMVGDEESHLPVVGVADIEVSFSGVNVQAEFIVAKTLGAEGGFLGTEPACYQC